MTLANGLKELENRSYFTRRPAQAQPLDFEKLFASTLNHSGLDVIGSTQGGRPVQNNTSIAVDRNNNIVLCDSYEGVFFLDEMNSVKRQVKVPVREGEDGNEAIAFNNVKSIVIDKVSNNIIMADSGNHRIVVLDERGNLVNSFGTRGGNDGEFQSPRALVVTSDQRIVVSDSINDRFQIFDKNGVFIKSFRSNPRPGHGGMMHGGFGPQTSMTIDSKDRIFYTDTQPGMIIIFDDQGKEIGSVYHQDHTQGPTNFSFVTVDKFDNIIAVSRSNGSIHVFSPAGKHLNQFNVGASYQATLAVDPCNKLLICNPNPFKIISVSNE